MGFPRQEYRSEKDVTVARNSSSPVRSGRRSISVQSGSPQLQPLLMVSTEELMMWKKTQDTGPRIAEVHMERMISVSPENSCILPYIKKC